MDNSTGMESNAQTVSQLRLELAKERLAHAQTTAAYNLLHACTRGALAPPAQPGPRWPGESH